ncbi:methyltransferase domain-containing protein [Patescibacteria group bacterium]|nr:methyltransferase domain-containing protein [Patescibacteria group bacterium]MBU1448998.1 methyltransferase domain-containing protein [Patescibacteria group bacterium]MBU2613291.1 methyltransferase domain-containing protein [Patescibacteria group bacterium]
MDHFLVFGRHPRLSLAEFSSTRPHAYVRALAGAGAVVRDADWDGASLMQALGGCVKVGDVHLEMPHTDLDADVITDLLRSKLRGGRVIFGLSVLGGTPAARTRLEKLALGVKRACSMTGASARWVTSKQNASLSPAAVAKLHLTTDGYDIVLLVHGETVSIGLTTDVQDADAWSLRDYGRPIRDDENGMLPPKLARIMVNLARVTDGGTMCDPFCGSGTVLMEAALATHASTIIGSDIEERQVASTQENLAWCVGKRIFRKDDMKRFDLITSDVRTLTKHLKPNCVDSVVTEGSLGPLLSGHETLPTLQKNVEGITTLWRDTFAALHPLVRKGGRMVCVWPAFKTSHGMARIDLTDDPGLEGWRMADGDPLLYHRPGQRVMRRIVILDRSA